MTTKKDAKNGEIIEPSENKSDTKKAEPVTVIGEFVWDDGINTCVGGDPIITSGQVRIHGSLFVRSGIRRGPSVEITATDGQITIRKIEAAPSIPQLETSPKKKKRSVVDDLLDDAKFRQRMQKGQLTDEELDQLEADEKAAEAAEAEREAANTISGW